MASSTSRRRSPASRAWPTSASSPPRPQGQFAVRGGILDVYPAGSTSPVRAELFGDEIETLRHYVPSTGQAIGDAASIEVFPCRELAISSRGAEAAEKALYDRSLKEPSIAHELELLREGVYFNGIERYLPLFYKRVGRATDYLGADTLVVVAEPRSLFDDAVRRREELEAGAPHRLLLLNKPTLEGLYLTPAELDFGERQRLTLVSLHRAGAGVDAQLLARRPEVTGGEERFIGGVRSLATTGYSIALAVPDRRTRRRIADALADAGVAFTEQRDHVSPADAPTADAPLDAKALTLTDTDVPAGFVIPDAKVAVISIDDVYPRSSIRRARRQIDPTRVTFGFAPGDFVVHATHGIALFKEIVRQEVLGAERDYLLLEYSKGDKLYVPVEQIDRVTKYVGAEGSSPRVTRLNTADWSKATGKARKAARQLAFDLVDLYARRSTVTGFAYGADTPWQLEMEASFPFEETPDQLAAIADVKADMESEKPMDRLICGDVGYGKTEVAIRAAFKATQDGKQVMVLCPTTILAQQHFTTFSERFAPYPVKVEVLSRFRSDEQQKAALAGLPRRRGRHPHRNAPPALARRRAQEPRPRDHRRGAALRRRAQGAHEEPARAGRRADPLGDADSPHAADVAVRRARHERHRHRAAQPLPGAGARGGVGRGRRLRRRAPRARARRAGLLREQPRQDDRRRRPARDRRRPGGARGRRARADERARARGGHGGVLGKRGRRARGHDHHRVRHRQPALQHAHHRGLPAPRPRAALPAQGSCRPQPHQGVRLLPVPGDAALTEQAIERLTAIGENTDLGSGIKVAMRDLEIRGAGSLLGAEQSGQMSAVGFDLFAQMINEAVSEARGEPVAAFPDIRVDLPVAAFLPEEYVSAADERVRYYRRLAGSPSIEAIDAIAAEMSETFGSPPETARNLVAIARIRAMAAEAGANNVAIIRRRLTVWPLSLSDEKRGQLAAQGAVWLEREKKIARPLEYGESVTHAALGMLAAILAPV